MEEKFTRLSIKADKTGIAVYVPAHMSTDEICTELYHRFSVNAYAFEKKGTVAVSFRGNRPSETELYKIINFLNNLDMSNVSFRLGQEFENVTTAKYIEPSCGDILKNVYDPQDSICHKKCGVTDKNIPYIFIGNMGRKQTLEIKGNIIIIGNVARDAKVISGKNIIVIGDLYGTAIAGKCSIGNSYVLAMHMEPRFLQIGRGRSENPDIINYPKSSVVATNDGTSISITYI